MALLLMVSGVGFVVPAALGAPGGVPGPPQADQGPPPGQGPDGAGPPGQLNKQQAGPGAPHGNGNGNGRPSGPPQATAAQVVQTVNGNGRGPDGAGPPGQLKKQAGPANGNGNGNGRGGANLAAPAAAAHPAPPAVSARAASASPPPAPPVAAPTRATRSGLGSRRRSGIGRPRSLARRSGPFRRSNLVGRPSASSRPIASPGTAGTLALTTGGRTGALASTLEESGSGGVPAVAGPLAPGTAQLARGATAGSRSATAAASARRSRRKTGLLGTAIPDPAGTVIERFINVIPVGVWIALAAALALAALAGVAALRSGRRVRIQAGEVAAVTAAALTDPLTGVMNRRGFIEAAERELLRARRYDHPVALAFVDIRGLKAVNDTEGHLAGDRLLRQVTTLLRESARTHDLVGRIGGDEMAVLLAEQSVAGAAAMIQRVRAQVPAARARLGFPTPWDVTIGTAAFPEDGDTFEELLAAADRRLYEQRGIRLA